MSSGILNGLEPSPRLHATGVLRVLYAIPPLIGLATFLLYNTNLPLRSYFNIEPGKATTLPPALLLSSIHL